MKEAQQSWFVTRQIDTINVHLRNVLQGQRSAALQMQYAAFSSTMLRETDYILVESCVVGRNFPKILSIDTN